MGKLYVRSKSVHFRTPGEVVELEADLAHAVVLAGSADYVAPPVIAGTTESTSPPSTAASLLPEPVEEGRGGPRRYQRRDMQAE